MRSLGLMGPQTMFSLQVTGLKKSCHFSANCLLCFIGQVIAASLTLTCDSSNNRNLR